MRAKMFIKRNWELFACAAIFGTTIIFGVCTNMESANADIVEEPIDVPSTTTVVTTEPVTTTTAQTTRMTTSTTATFTTSNAMTTTTSSTTIGWLYETDVETTVETIIVDVSDGEMICYEYEGTNDDGDIIIVVTDETKPSTSHTTNTTTTTTTTVATTTTVLQPETTSVVVLEEPTEITEVETLPVDESDYILLCNCVAHEAGANSIPVYDKALVVEVVMNRVADTRWPNTVYEVITQRKQFTGSATYADLGTYSHKVSDQVKEAVDLYFADPSQFNHGYTGFWGDGKRNHFS